MNWVQWMSPFILRSLLKTKTTRCCAEEDQSQKMRAIDEHQDHPGLCSLSSMLVYILVTTAHFQRMPRIPQEVTIDAKSTLGCRPDFTWEVWNIGISPLKHFTAALKDNSRFALFIEILLPLLTPGGEAASTWILRHLILNIVLFKIHWRWYHILKGFFFFSEFANWILSSVGMTIEWLFLCAVCNRYQSTWSNMVRNVTCLREAAPEPSSQELVFALQR